MNILLCVGSRAFLGVSCDYVVRGRRQSLQSLDLSNFDTSNVTGMERMFEGCSSLQTLDLSGFDTSRVGSMAQMFSGCSSLRSLDLSSFDASQVTNISHMFDGRSNLDTVYVSERSTLGSGVNTEGMFDGASKLVGEKGTTYDDSHTDGEYAHIDNPPDSPGYFTYRGTGGITQKYVIGDTSREGDTVSTEVQNQSGRGAKLIVATYDNKGKLLTYVTNVIALPDIPQGETKTVSLELDPTGAAEIRIYLIDPDTCQPPGRVRSIRIP